MWLKGEVPVRYCDPSRCMTFGVLILILMLTLMVIEMVCNAHADAYADGSYQ